MDVPFYEPRNVEIKFTSPYPRTAKVFVDGPPSPHRYGDGSLCIWYPDDPPEQRWLFEDGLLALLNLVQAHLFREAWRREHDGDWPGLEAPHGLLKEQVNEDDRDPDRPDHLRHPDH